MKNYKSHDKTRCISCDPLPGDGRSISYSTANLIALVKRGTQGNLKTVPNQKTLVIEGVEGVRVFKLGTNPEKIDYYDDNVSLTSCLLQLQKASGITGSGSKVKIY